MHDLLINLRRVGVLSGVKLLNRLPITPIRGYGIGTGRRDAKRLIFPTRVRYRFCRKNTGYIRVNLKTRFVEVNCTQIAVSLFLFLCSVQHRFFFISPF